MSYWKRNGKLQKGIVLLGAFMAGLAWAGTSSFTGVYNGAGTSGGACGVSYSIAGEEPSTTGTYPVFIYMVGTSESYNNASAMAAVDDMANKGYVAATINYATSAFGDCTTLSGKASCAFNPNSSASAISQICSRAKADCSKGVVLGGFSQGAVLATLAKNYDSRVSAVYAMGLSNVYSVYNLSTCVSNGKRLLPSDHLRAVDGEADSFAGGSQSAVQSTLQTVTGLNCASGSTSCLNSNNSGWVVVKNAQVQDGQADHCYMRYGGCGLNQNTLDSGWKSGTAAWELDTNLQWLTNFTSH